MTSSQAKDRVWFGLAAGCAVLTLLAFSTAGAQSLDETADTPPEAKAAKPKIADKPVRPTAKTHPNDPMIWDIEQMMEDAVMQIARRYNLNEKQEVYTRLLLKTRVREFLKDHEGDVRELLQESISMKTGKSSRDAAALQQWADRAQPLYDAAMNAILEGNTEWGEILDEDQKKIHDGDLALMRKNAVVVNKTLDEWSEGKGKLPASMANRSTAARTVSDQTGAGQVSDGGRQSRNRLIEDNWTAYANAFISVYQLTEKQQNAARNSILKDELAKARKYRQTNKTKFAKIEADLREPTPKLPRMVSQQRRATLQQRKRDLEKPIRKMFVTLDRRLKELPDSKQRAAVDPLRLKGLEAQYNMLAKEPVAGLKPAKTNVKLKPDVPSNASASVKAAKTADSQPTATAAPAETTPPAEGPTKKPATSKPAAQ